MSINSLYLGEVDAKNEILKQKRAGVDYFINSFLLPKSFNNNDYINGQKYFIHGLKGTGKTAYLHYLHKSILNKGSISEIILFKSHVSEEDRQGLSKGAGFQILSTSGVPSFNQDFKESWKWMIYQKIAEILNKNGFVGPHVEKLFKITGVSSTEGSNSLGSLFSSITSGNLKFKGAAFGVAVELGLEGKKRDDEITVSLSNVNRVCARLIDEIDLREGLYILFDELELFHQTQDQYDRDRRIIRDLIFTISHMNGDSAEKSRKLFLISTLRTEVLHTVLELGHEINKEVDDFGQKIDWSNANAGPNHPLLTMIAKKISISSQIKEEDVWNKYFPEKINNQEYYKFILGSSYYRPRDIVRLLKIACSFNPDSEKFTTEHFDQTSLEFSKQTWIETTEELLATYSPQEINSLQRFFLGFNTLFFKNQIEKRLKTKYANDKQVNDLFNKKGISAILSDLYRLGVIGNSFVVKKSGRKSETKYRWIFRGNTTLNDSERMLIHKSLWKHLTLTPGVEA